MDEMSSMDLDTPLDWKIAEYIAQETNYWNA
jgi:CMP-N-acetylneuraminic acid synthetase